MRLALSYTTPCACIRFISFWSHPKQCVQFFVRLMNEGVTLIFLPLVLSLLVMKHCQKVPHPDGRAYLFLNEEDSEESDESSSIDNESQVQLNRFLQLRDVSPVRHTLSVQWNTVQCWMSCHLKSRKNCGGSFVIVTLYAARVRLWSKAEVKKRRSFLMHLLKATWKRNIGAPDDKYALWWQTSYPLGRWGSLFQPLIAIATTLPDATGWYMEKLLLFQTRRKGEWELSL